MAATRLIAMHLNKGKTIAQCLRDRTAYALNEEKTEHGTYVSSYACNAEIADKEFVESKREYFRITGRKPKGDIIAYQVRQSFKPGEITPEEANQIGYETVLRFTKGEHAFIVATHTDKAHIHNHVIFNSTNLACNRKFRDSWFIALALKRLSDLVCLEHGLSIIIPRKPGEREHGVTFPEKETKRSILCEDIDEILLRKPIDLKAFLKELQEKEYEIKSGKYISVRKKGQNRFIRLQSLGEGYSLKDIEKRIQGESETEREVRLSKKRWKRPKQEFDLLIDIQEKMKQGKGAGYSKWATVYNVKQMAQTLLFLQERDVRSYEKLEEMATNASGRFHELSIKIKNAEKQLGEIAVLKTHIINYSKTRKTYIAYQKSGYSKVYFEEHREELTLYKAARDAFNNISGKRIPRVKELNEEYVKILAEKKATYAEYRQMKKEMIDFVKAKHNVDTFLKISEKEKTKGKEIVIF